MHDTPAAADETPFRTLLIAGFAYRRRVLITVASILGLACATAAVMSSKYSAHASVLTLLGTEYTYRPLAGQASPSNAALERQEVLQTEIEILQSDDLHRALIRRVGLARLYPDYVNPGFFKTAITFVLGLPTLVAETLTGERPDKPLDPVELALLEFNSAFSAVPVKDGNSIELTFIHKDPALAAETLNTLDEMYIAMRRTVFSDQQAALVEAQVAKLKDALGTADARLAEFRLANDASAFATRREIVLHAQGDAQKDAQEAEGAVGQDEAKLATLQGQLKSLPAEVQSGSEADIDQRLSPIRASLDSLRAKQAELLASYRPDSVSVRAIQVQIAAREAELGSKRRDVALSGFHYAQNPLRESVNGDLLHVQADLDAARARRAHAQAVLQGLAAQLRTLDENERQLDQLERQRGVAEDAYRDAAKVLEERRIADEIESRKQASVRIVQPAAVPIKARLTRKLIVLGGFVFALLSGAGTVLLSNLARRCYLTPDELERDLGVAVLACVPERSAASARALTLGVAPGIALGASHA